MTQNPTGLEIAQAKQIKKLQSQIVIALTYLKPLDDCKKNCSIWKAVAGLEEVLNERD